MNEKEEEKSWNETEFTECIEIKNWNNKLGFMEDCGASKHYCGWINF